MARNTPKPTLIVLTTESGQSEEHLLAEGSSLIGRSSENAIVLHDTLVSRQHGEVHFDGNSVVLRNKGGKNPIRVNGKDINDTRDYQLLHNDRITIGESELHFLFEGAGENSKRLRVFKDVDEADTKVEDLSLEATTLVFPR